MRRIFSQALALLVAGMPFVAQAAGAPTDVKSLAATVVSVLNLVTLLAIGLAVVYYFAGITRAMAESGSAKSWERLRTQVLWGILSIVIIVSVWGIINLFTQAIFGTSQSASSSPTHQNPAAGRLPF